MRSIYIRHILTLALLLVIGATPVANRCVNEAGWDGGVRLCACTVRARIAAGWMPELVLGPYLAADGVATPAQIEQARLGLEGVGCPDDAYYLFSEACIATTGVRMECATGFSQNGNKRIYTFGRDALNSCVGGQ